MSVDHYENFPVASWLCPPRLRPPIAAIYWFARTADDIADEGDAAPTERIAKLEAYQAELQRLAQGGHPDGPWPEVFKPLQIAIRDFKLPINLLDDLLRAFMQDVANPLYADRQALLAYCALSANPVGRLLLHLHHLQDEPALSQSDAICSALQLINFWQDLSVDLPRGRIYLPQHDLQALAVQPGPASQTTSRSDQQVLVERLCAWAEALMLEGAPLVHRLPGRAGWELRLVVQGGLRILEKIRAMDYRSHQRRPVLGPMDLPLMLWRSAWMRPDRTYRNTNE